MTRAERGGTGDSHPPSSSSQRSRSSSRSSSHRPSSPWSSRHRATSVPRGERHTTQYCRIASGSKRREARSGRRAGSQATHDRHQFVRVRALIAVSADRRRNGPDGHRAVSIHASGDVAKAVGRSHVGTDHPRRQSGCDRHNGLYVSRLRSLDCRLEVEDSNGAAV